MTSTLSTRDQILDCAKKLIQIHGYNGFSFRDIAGFIGIKSASIHYHFPGKSDLAVAVASRYRQVFMKITQNLASSENTTSAKLYAYADLFESTLKSENKLCLCGMLASEVNSVDQDLRNEISDFFKEQHELLTGVIEQGQSNGEFRSEIHTVDFAKAYLAALEGAMIMARIDNAPTDIKRTAKQLVSLIEIQV